MNEVLNRLKRVRYIGNQTAKILYEREGIEGVEGLLELGQDKLKDVHGIGDHKAKLILESARELKDKFEKCGSCGFYSEKNLTCPYCEEPVNNRTEDSIVDNFIKSKNKLEYPVGKGNLFYKKMSDMIDQQSKGYDVGENLVNKFVNTRKKKRELDQKLRNIKVRLNNLEKEEFIYSSHIESIYLLLDKVEKLEDKGRYHACFELLENLEDGIAVMESVGDTINELNKKVENLDEDELTLDLDSHLYRLEKIYSIGKYEDAKGYVDYLIRSIEENGNRAEISQSSRRFKSGDINGFPKSQEEGFINGLENGYMADSKSEEGKGFINGLENGSKVDYKSENGFINGLREDKRSLERRLKWKKTAVSTMVLFLIIGIVFGSAYFFIYEEPDEGILIDGDFEDWEDVDRVQIEMVGVSPSANIVECAVERSRDRLNYYFKTEEDALVGGSDKRMDAVYIFIQTGDGNNFYRTGELEAHYMVKIQGWGDSVYGQLYRYENETLDNNWFGWTHLAGLEIEKSENEVEFSFPEMYVRDREVHSQLIALDHTGVQREAEHLVSPDKPSLTVHQSGLDKDVLDGGDIVSELVLRSSGPVKIESLEFEGHEYFGSISFEPEVDIPIELESEEEFRVSVSGVPAVEAGEKVELEVVDVESDAVSRIVGSGASYYFGEVPEEVVIDGAFGDWIEYEEAPDSDVPDRIDIQRYGLQMYDNDAYFMLSTSGNILEGTAIPEGVERYVEELRDSDGDGIPDIYDPYPNDFTNDGTPDSEMVTEDGLPDVDGDGVADWPYGPDKWLNTTIPEDPRIPERYWGREVSRYIGPRPDPLRTGEDTIEVYLDIGDGEGYDIMGSRAEYRLRIKGQYGEVRNVEVQQWNGDIWLDVDNDLDVAISGDSIEFACYGLEGVLDGYEVVFVTADWSTNRDSVILSAVQKNPGMVLTSKETHQNFYLRGNDVLLTERGADESIVNLVNKDGGREHGWMFEEFAGDFEITGDMEALLYLDPTTRGANRPGVRLTLSTGSGVISQGEIDGLSSEGWYTIPLELDYHKIPKGESMTLTISITGPDDTEALELDVYYNSQDRASRLNVPTNTTIDVVDVETFNGEGVYQDVFEGGDEVEIRGNITHAISADLIQGTEVTVYYPDGSVLLEDQMELYSGDSQEPPFYSIFNYSFVLEDDTPSGSYEVRVNAWDDQDNTDSNSTFFSVPDYPGVSVYPDRHEIGESGGNVNFTANVKNIGNVDDSYRLEAGESSRGWTTNLYHDGYLIAEDIDGTGEWDWVDASWDSDGVLEIYIEETQEKTFVVEKIVPEDTEGLTDETELHAISMNFTDVSDDSLLKTEIPFTEEVKTFYLLNADILNTFMGDDTVETTIDADGSNVWVQDPPMAEDFSLIDSAIVHLYIEPHTSGHRVPDVTVSLFEEGDVIGTDTITDIEEDGWYSFSFSTGHKVSGGNPMELQVSTGEAGITVHYNSGEYDSRLEVLTDTYIEVLDVKTYDGEMETDEFSAGDEVGVEAMIGDPIGSYDIAGANVSISDPNGTVLLDDQPMDLGEVDRSEPSYWANFTRAFELPEDALSGSYEIKVKAIESNGVTSFGYGTFDVVSGVDVYPDHNDTAQAGGNVTYEHTIQNTGSGTDIFHMHVTSSQGFNVSLYSEHGELIGQDVSGDGDWDYVNPDWDTTGDGIPDTGWVGSDESINISLGIEIPADVGNVTDETTLQTGSYYSDASDEAVDITTIPEFEFKRFTLSIGFILILNLLIFKFKKKNPKDDE